MTIPLGATVTVTVVRPAAPDRFGDPSGAVTTHDVAGCVVWADESGEDTDHAETVTVPAVLVGPAGADILATDRVTVGAATYEVVGEPLERRSPYTAAELVEVRMRKVTG